MRLNLNQDGSHPSDHSQLVPIRELDQHLGTNKLAWALEPPSILAKADLLLLQITIITTTMQNQCRRRCSLTSRRQQRYCRGVVAVAVETTLEIAMIHHNLQMMPTASCLPGS